MTSGFSIEALATLDTQSQVQLAVLLVVPLLAVVVFFCSGRSLPGKLRPRDTVVAEKVCYNKLKWFLQQELGRIPGAIDLGMTSQWTVVDRIIYFISASPGFDFVMRHKVPPRILQPKYLILVSNGGQVRVALFAFVSKQADPGATAGPFVVKLVSEDLRSADRDSRSFSKFTYTTRPASCSDMEKIISGMVPAILKGVDQDKWDAFERA
eukprot:g14867.t1